MIHSVMPILHYQYILEVFCRFMATAKWKTYMTFKQIFTMETIKKNIYTFNKFMSVLLIFALIIK